MSAADFTQPAPAVSAASTPDPSPASTPGQPTYPSTAALLDIGTSTPNVYWPATGSAGSDTVAALGALGSADDPAHVLVPSTSVAGGARQAAAAVGGVSTPVYDAEVSRALADAAGQNDATFRGPPSRPHRGISRSPARRPEHSPCWPYSTAAPTARA